MSCINDVSSKMLRKTINLLRKHLVSLRKQLRKLSITTETFVRKCKMMDKISTQYNQAVQLIKSAILQNQLEAAKAVNRQMLALYYGVGKYVSDNTRKGVWGTGAIETISEQFRRAFPKQLHIGRETHQAFIATCDNPHVCPQKWS